MQAITGSESLRDYIRNFETTNLLSTYPGRGPGGKGDLFPMPDARAAATVLRPALAGRIVVYVGGRVAEAFGWPAGIEPFQWLAEGAYAAALCPHPSPVSRYWNDGEHWTRARGFFAEAKAWASLRYLERKERLGLVLDALPA